MGKFVALLGGALRDFYLDIKTAEPQLPDDLVIVSLNLLEILLYLVPSPPPHSSPTSQS
jgi:hypothetical protein